MANCDKMKSNYSGYIEGGLPADQYKILDDHLSACPGCREPSGRWKSSGRA